MTMGSDVTSGRPRGIRARVSLSRAAFLLALAIASTSLRADPPGSAGQAELPPDTRAADEPADVPAKPEATPAPHAEVAKPTPFVESVEFVNKSYFRDETLKSFMLQ